MSDLLTTPTDADLAAPTYPPMTTIDRDRIAACVLMLERAVDFVGAYNGAACARQVEAVARTALRREARTHNPKVVREIIRATRATVHRRREADGDMHLALSCHDIDEY